MADSTRSVARLLALDLTPGKLRGLQRISNDNGTLTMVALDQNSAMIGLIKESFAKKGVNREPTYQEIVEAKVHMARTLGPSASGLLIDAYYGAWSAVASGAFPRNTGMLIRVEKSGGPKNKAGAPLGEFETFWSVGKIKRLGCDAVKILAPYEPTEPESAEHQFQFIKQVYDDCQKHDILFLLETIAFPFGGEDKKSASFLDRKAETVIESARQLSRYCDVYKAEFPGWLGKHTEEQLANNLKHLDVVCERPWVLLSAGVDFPDYLKQIELSMKCGASGILGGRAFWKEYFLHDSFETRDRFAKGECVERIATAHKVVYNQAKPWWTRYGITPDEMAGFRATEGWHKRYAGPVSAVGEGSKYVEGEVY